jgi:hypothetical protein
VNALWWLVPTVIICIVCIVTLVIIVVDLTKEIWRSS